MSSSFQQSDVNAISLRTGTLDISNSLTTPILRTNLIRPINTQLNVATDISRVSLTIGNDTANVKIRGKIDLNGIQDFHMTGVFNQL